MSMLKRKNETMTKHEMTTIAVASEQQHEVIISRAVEDHRELRRIGTCSALYNHSTRTVALLHGRVHDDEQVQSPEPTVI